MLVVEMSVPVLGSIVLSEQGQFLEAQPWLGPVLEPKALLPFRQNCEMLFFSSLQLELIDAKDLSHYF